MLQASENHDLVNAIHELRRESAPCRFHCGSMDTLIKVGSYFARGQRWSKPIGRR